jgi:hypothetical protein
VTRHKGPALLYITSDGDEIPVDEQAVPGRRERRLYRALTAQADELADEADSADEAPAERPFGFTLTADTQRTED